MPDKKPQDEKQWLALGIMLEVWKSAVNDITAGRLDVPLSPQDKRVLVAATRGAIRAYNQRSVCNLGMEMFLMGASLGSNNYRLLTAKREQRKDHARSIGRGNRLSEVEKQARSRRWQIAVDAMMRKNPHMNYTAASERVGLQQAPAVSGKTIRRYTHKPAD